MKKFEIIEPFYGRPIVRKYLRRIRSFLGFAKHGKKPTFVITKTVAFFASLANQNNGRSNLSLASAIDQVSWADDAYT